VVWIRSFIQTVHAEEIKEPSGDNFGPKTKLWPKNMVFDLITVPKEGAVLSQTEYEAHREFYDNFFKGGNRTFIQRGYVFKDVNIQRREK